MVEDAANQLELGSAASARTTLEALLLHLARGVRQFASVPVLEQKVSQWRCDVEMRLSYLRDAQLVQAKPSDCVPGVAELVAAYESAHHAAVGHATSDVVAGRWYSAKSQLQHALARIDRALARTSLLEDDRALMRAWRNDLELRLLLVTQRNHNPTSLSSLQDFLQLLTGAPPPPYTEG